MTRAELFEDCQPLVERAVRRCHIQGSGQDDARQAAYEALWLATGRFDPERAASFRAYAKQLVFGAVRNWLTSENRGVSEEPEELTARPADKPGEPSTSEDIESELCAAIDTERLHRFVARLPAMRRRVVESELRGECATEHAKRRRTPPSTERARRKAAYRSLRVALTLSGFVSQA